MRGRENTCLSGAQTLPITCCFYTRPGSIAEPISHLEMEPSTKGRGRGGMEHASVLGSTQQTGNRKRLAWSGKGERGHRSTQEGYWPGVGPTGHLWREVRAPMGTGTSSSTTTGKREKGALYPSRQRANDTINTFGLKVPGKGSQCYLPGLGLAASLATTAHSGYCHPCLHHHCPRSSSA